MYDIDFVITWVDGNDPAWQAEKVQAWEKECCNDENANTEARFREWNLLQYLFRGIEFYAPWVRRIHFVTWGHVPEWMKTDHPKLHIVKHSDFIPEQYLPTFNSHTIEFHLHRIDGLSDRFVYFNDDSFLCRPVSPEFYFKEGLPCDYGMLDCIYPRSGTTMHYVANAIAVLNEHFTTREIRQQPLLWYHMSYGIKHVAINYFYSKYSYLTGFRNGHLPQSYLKDTFDDIWSQEGERLEQTTMTRFRSDSNISVWLIRYWQLLKGRFRPTGLDARGKCYTEYSEQMLADISAGRHPMICVNDLCKTQEDFSHWQPRIKEAFEKLLPEKSSFEL